MSALHVGDPIADRLVDGVLQGAATGLDRAHVRAQQVHAEDVERLALDIFGAHVDYALLLEHGADRGGGDPVLAGAGLGDDAFLAHAAGQQSLAQRVVYLVGAGMGEVLSLEVYLRATEVPAQVSGVV